MRFYRVAVLVVRLIDMSFGLFLVRSLYKDNIIIDRYMTDRNQPFISDDSK